MIHKFWKGSHCLSIESNVLLIFFTSGDFQKEKIEKFFKKKLQNNLVKKEIRTFRSIVPSPLESPAPFFSFLLSRVPNLSLTGGKDEQNPLTKIIIHSFNSLSFFKGNNYFKLIFLNYSVLLFMSIYLKNVW